MLHAQYKVTVSPDIFGTIPNFDGLSWLHYDVSRDAELCRIPNPVPILSRFECNVTSHVDKVHTYGPYTEFVVVSWGAYDTPPADPLVGWGGDTLYLVM